MKEKQKRKIIRNKNYREKCFGIKKLVKNGYRFKKGVPVEVLSYIRLSNFYKRKFGTELAEDYKESVTNKTMVNANDFVYFIGNRDLGFVKIGYSKNPKLRLRQIQTNCPFEVKLLKMESGNTENETRYHMRFSDHNTYGEWFKIEGMLKVHLHEF
ncbi:GIY-YIG nuclease family protein [Flagellimonas flava]|uniref:GIY-YIG nuclease family protein n=1 Tax=Flagellimonas flava TaxID=570519 RepID=UPI003D658B45